MKNMHFGLISLFAAFPSALGTLASGIGKDSMYLGIPIRPSVQDSNGELSDLGVSSIGDTQTPTPSEPPSPETSAASGPDTSDPPAPAATPPANPIIESIAWEGTGCPSRESEDQTPSVEVQLQSDGSFGAYFFNNFNAYLGWTEDDVETEAECLISMELTGIPKGWSFQVRDVRAEGYIYLELGAVAVLNSTIFWDGDEDHAFTMGRHLPNLSQQSPVDRTFVTDPMLLTAEDQAEFGSTCAPEGDGSGTLNLGFRISMQSDVEPAPNGIVSVRALGITNRLVQCGPTEKVTPGYRRRARK